MWHFKREPSRLRTEHTCDLTRGRALRGSRAPAWWRQGDEIQGQQVWIPHLRGLTVEQERGEGSEVPDMSEKSWSAGPVN